MTTFNVKQSDVTKQWWIIDATDKTLGRLAAQIAHVLRGKHKRTFTPHLVMGDCIVVINAEKVHLTGNKKRDKLYYRATSRPGSLKAISVAEYLSKKPIVVLERAVRGMLPKGPLGRAIFRNLKVYSGSKHPHIAQMPKVLTD